MIRLVLAIIVAAAVGATAASAGGETPALGRLAGQTIMTGFGGRTPGASLLDRAGQVGGVILFKSNIAGRDRLRSSRGRSSPAS